MCHIATIHIYWLDIYVVSFIAFCQDKQNIFLCVGKYDKFYGQTGGNTKCIILSIEPIVGKPSETIDGTLCHTDIVSYKLFTPHITRIPLDPWTSGRPNT